MPRIVKNAFGVGITAKVYISGDCELCRKHSFDLKKYQGRYETYDVCGDCQCPCGYLRNECEKHADDRTECELE